MKYEKSCGAVVFTKIKNKFKYLIIQSINGIYGFPKGHVEDNETEIETTLREVYEEVKLKINVIEGFRIIDEYKIPKKDIVKTVVFFLGEFYDQKYQIQLEELLSAVLVDYETAMNLLQYESSKKILKAANDFIINLYETQNT